MDNLAGGLQEFFLSFGVGLSLLNLPGAGLQTDYNRIKKQKLISSLNLPFFLQTKHLQFDLAALF